MQTNYVYTLKLLNDKYYVGLSIDVIFDFMNHLNGYGSEWTKIYEPLEIIETIQSDNLNETIIKCMINYGINNVRGGMYEKQILDDDDIHHIRTEIWRYKKCCIKCGRGDHDESICNEKIDVLGNMILDEECIYCDICEKYFHDNDVYNSHQKQCQKNISKIKYNDNVCYKCGKQGHYMKFCKAKNIK
jgi:hypothetical protein